MLSELHPSIVADKKQYNSELKKFEEFSRYSIQFPPQSRQSLRLSIETVVLVPLLDIVISFDQEHYNTFRTYHHGRVAWFANDRELGLQSEQLLLNSLETGIEIMAGDLDGNGDAEIVTSTGIVDGMFVIDVSKFGDLTKDGKLNVDDLDRICLAIRDGENDKRIFK